MVLWYREGEATLRELGLDPLMVDATVARQREMGAIGKHEKVRASLKAGRTAMLNAISAAAKGSPLKPYRFGLNPSLAPAFFVSMIVFGNLFPVLWQHVFAMQT